MVEPLTLGTIFDFNYGGFATIRILDNKKAHISVSFNDWSLYRVIRPV